MARVDTTGQSHDDIRSLGFGAALGLVFLPFACGYFFSYFYRVVNAMVAPDLQADIGVNAEQLGLLSAAYFLSFATCQIPLGVLLDRFGPRKVQGTLYGIAAIGALVFATGDSVTTLFLGRAIIGIGVSGGLMAALKAIVLWFPRERIALVNGWYIACGGLGILAATQPVAFALEFTDWRGLFVILAASTLAAGILILIVVPEKPASAAQGSLKEQVAEILSIYRSRYFWRLTPLMFTCASAAMAIQGLWAGPWLADVNGLPRDEVAPVLLVTAAAFTLGVFFSGPFATLLRRIAGLGIPASCCVAAVLHTAAMLWMVSLPNVSPFLPWALFGFLGTITSLAFAGLADRFPPTQIGRANTACNVLVFAFAFGYQYGVGAIIELWPATAGGGYPVQAYVWAFLAVIATQVAAIVWYFVAPRDRAHST